MPAPEIIRQLVQRFEEHKDAYRSSRYNEAQLRQEFLNPFFEALGWDVANKKGYAIQYREVIHEDSIHIQGSLLLSLRGTTAKRPARKQSRLSIADCFASSQ